MFKLREMLEKDLDFVLEWRNQDNVRRNMYTCHKITKEEHLAWWCKTNEEDSTVLLIAENDKQPVGFISFSHITGINGIATWAFYAGDKAPKGTGSRMEYHALNYAFNTLKLRRLECEVLDFNLPVVRLHQRHGFTIEGIFRNKYERNGRFYDIYFLSINSKIWLKYVKPCIDEQGSNRFGLIGKVYKKNTRITADLINNYAYVTGDNNPIHMDIKEAKKSGFNNRIAQGMLSGGILSAIFGTEFPGVGTVYLSQDFKFLEPVELGSTLCTEVRVLSQIGRRIIIECTQKVNDKICVTGEASLLIPKSI